MCKLIEFFFLLEAKQLSTLVAIYNVIEPYKVEIIPNFYSLAYNYKNLSARVHCILKYPRVLTMASKMKLKTEFFFRRYGGRMNYN